MTPHIHDDYESMSRAAAETIAEALRDDPDLLLCAPTGSSPKRAYAILAEQRRREPRLFDRMRVLKLDEWGELPMDHPGTCEEYLRRHVVAPLGIAPDRYFTFRADLEDLDSECRYARDHLDREGPIDICLLGLGLNGHLGLNEPAAELSRGPHVARLTEETGRHPMLEEGAAPLKYGVTLGMADLLHARRILLLVNGPHKRAALRRLLDGEVSTAFPASLLHLHHRVTLLCDRAAVEGGP